MLTGYIIHKVKTPPKISGRINILLWILSLGLLALIIFGVWEGQLNEVSTAFYVSIGHTGKLCKNVFVLNDVIIHNLIFYSLSFRI